jgi:peptide-methionine (S)-S-oxide reductase
MLAFASVSSFACQRPLASAHKVDLTQMTSRGLCRTQSSPKELPPTQLARFAAGCFWGVEAELRKVPGVVGTAVGFAGGHTQLPNYHTVCQGNTGHAESVEVEFDPKVVSYEQLLAVFWDLHDPTTPNRSGPDVGEQYRSVIFYFSPEQKAAEIASRDRLAKSGELKARIVTEIVPAEEFWKAEDYHQQYVEKGGIAFCHRRKSSSL